MVRQVLLTGEKPQKRPPLQSYVVTNGSAEHGVAGLKRIEDRLQCNPALDLKLDLAFHVCQIAKMRGKNDSNHSLWQRLHLDRQYCRQIANDGVPALASICRRVDLAARSAEVDPTFVERIDGHSIPQHVHVAVFLR